MQIFYAPIQSSYNPKFEYTGSELRPYPEMAERIDWIIAAMKENNYEDYLATPQLCDLDKITNVHDVGYVNFLQSLSKDVTEQVPMTLFPEGARLIPDNESTFPMRAGYYFFSVDTPMTSSSFAAAHASASSALDCIKSILSNANISIALSRPPGHHAMHSKGGGYCFFNNVAIAAQDAISKSKDVAILDLDYHHGNGTQEIFYSTSKVQYVSIHAKDAYPYYWGGREEIGEGDGKNFNINFPTSNLTNTERYDELLTVAIDKIKDYNPDVLLVSMGFDTYFDDPIAGMELPVSYYRQIGDKLADFPKLGIILEGGYSPQIGKCFVNLLESFV